VRGARRLVIIVLALVAAALIVAVIAKYWPPEVERAAREALGWLRDEGVATWRRIGGRWVTLIMVALGIGAGIVVLRRERWLGLVIIEVSVVGGAVVALLQPDGW
jgi:hypothetical protein